MQNGRTKDHYALALSLSEFLVFYAGIPTACQTAFVKIKNAEQLFVSGVQQGSGWLVLCIVVGL
jgi:hypothetical protein